jgi:hypothetical protein
MSCVLCMSTILFYFWSRDIAKIDRVGMELCKLGVALEQEDKAAGFLGVSMERDSRLGCLT